MKHIVKFHPSGHLLDLRIAIQRRSPSCSPPRFRRQLRRSLLPQSSLFPEGQKRASPRLVEDMAVEMMAAFVIMEEWREGVGVEPTRDVYSPILDLKSRGITGTLTLPQADGIPSGPRCQEPVEVMKLAYKVSEQRVCTTFEFARSVVHYESKANPQTAFRLRLRELAMARVGYDKNTAANQCPLKRPGGQDGRSLRITPKIAQALGMPAVVLRDQ